MTLGELDTGSVVCITQWFIASTMSVFLLLLIDWLLKYLIYFKRALFKQWYPQIQSSCCDRYIFLTIYIKIKYITIKIKTVSLCTTLMSPMSGTHWLNGYKIEKGENTLHLFDIQWGAIQSGSFGMSIIVLE